jgi:predicted phosphodiesterase
MNSAKTQVGELTIKELGRNPHVSKKGLARILRKKYPLVFRSLEVARSAARYYTGSCGQDNRSKIESYKHLLPVATRENPYQLPESDVKPWTPYQLPSTYRNIGVIGDIHCPYHVMDAMTLAIRELRGEKIDCLIINGDGMDMHYLSKFVKDPTKRHFLQEIDMFKGMLVSFRKALPSADILWKIGNHDVRYRNYIMQNAPEIFEGEETTLPKRLELTALEIGTIEHLRPIKVGHLFVLHGDEYKSVSQAVNPARGMMLKSHSCTLAHHNHQASAHSDVAIDGTVISSWSCGCLCDLHPEYMRYNKWVHGWARIEVDDDGNFAIHNRKIVNGRVYNA